MSYVTTDAALLTEISNLTAGHNREIVATQLRFHGADVTGFKAAVDAVTERYGAKIDNLAARGAAGADVSALRTAIVTLRDAVKSAAVSWVDVPPAA
ncbi:hypothetical protein [Bradyrhizobium sp. USDA 313]|uniref:hypothetical protein n=1 Tax=Bradyrhizobium sp. USDA 313 TaxID=3156307 RepID=UPI0035144868